MGMPTVKSYPIVPPGTAITADMQPVINALGLLPQAGLAQQILAAIQALPQDARAVAIINALGLLPLPSTKAREVTISLAAALLDSPVALGTLTSVQAITVKDLTGAIVPTIKLGGAGESPLTLRNGECRDNLQVASLLINCPAGGGNLVLELHGR